MSPEKIHRENGNVCFHIGNLLFKIIQFSAYTTFYFGGKVDSTFACTNL